ncbi:MAG: phosphoribosylanthranilate isomerase [Phormidesmis priestleyi]|uniref:N-(5'-phosphoribosyl)anthranilate isomerase n=1 Tax=Phormidesmis priestleyi TaxID=268141 RepID=A0A2W4XJ29_9CYAN|nr:MAG: phosphoribosylanthranilate isomerase [Phormidesmis priestleyi]
MLQVKICGITTVEQGSAIATLGATALGYICVSSSPRYISAERIAPIAAAVRAIAPEVQHFGVFANAPIADILSITKTADFSVIQLHGDETPATCQLLRDALSYANLAHIKLVKALRIKGSEDLDTAFSYEPHIDMLLLDAYHPDQLGGTGHTLDWAALKSFSPSRPWLLAGGLAPGNVLTALAKLSPSGIDLSSGLERSPGDKDLSKVRQLFDRLAIMTA